MAAQEKANLAEIAQLFKDRPMEKVTALAKLMKVSKSTVHRWVYEGQIKEAYKIFGQIFVPLDQEIPCEKY